MTEWLIAEPDDNTRTFDEKLTVWLMKNPLWVLTFNREVKRLCEIGVEFQVWEEIRIRAYWNIYQRHGGKKND